MDFEVRKKEKANLRTCHHYFSPQAGRIVNGFSFKKRTFLHSDKTFRTENLFLKRDGHCDIIFI